MKKLSIFLLMFVVVLISCKKTPPVNIQYVDVEREVLNIGSTTANIQCDYEYIATLKSAKLYYGRTEDNMNSVTMRVVQSVLYAEISGLSTNTTYKYYYEFENGFNSMKSGVKAFTTLDDGGGGSGDVPVGAIDGPFTVNYHGDKVYFSQGNLQYQASTNIWKFAENQWNQVGGQFYEGEIGNVYENGIKCDNMLVSATYSGWIDMFCWGTSGWDCGNTYYMPYDKDGEGEQYGPLGYSTLTGEFANSDWGVYNAIANGGNQPGLWRTLSDGEWQFIMRHRTNAEQKYSLAVVNGVHGCILLPDEWVCPTGLSFVPQSFDWTTNVYSEAQWTLMELNGAVFLPASGFRNPIALLNYDCCIYQTVNSGADFGNISFFINTEAYVPSPGHSRVLARSVRLVQDATPQPSVTTPTVITSNVSNITSNSAICGGEVISDGGGNIAERGICWSTSENPTMNDNHVAAGTGLGVFTATMNGLEVNTKYHVRAYATNEAGTAYGLDKTFTTLSGGGSGHEGALSGMFSVAPDRWVRFSKGNLQYQASTNTWRFAENQWDYVGDDIKGTVYENGEKCDNDLISSSYSGWIDLFGWGTSGYDNTANDPYAINYQPWSIVDEDVDTTYNKYGYGPSINQPDINLAGTSKNYDWGVYNAISNGGNVSGIWRTMSFQETNYMLGQREDAVNKRSIGTVHGVYGLILLPDVWYQPNGVNFVPDADNWETNVFADSQWILMENAGAVFLPASGYRIWNQVVSNYVQFSGEYWTSTRSGSTSWLAWYATGHFVFDPGGCYGGLSALHYYGRPVSLVQDDNP